jgi:anaerobic selenocysteine-containing dehydrogenase
MADLSLRTGVHGDRFLPGSKGLSVKKLKQAPHGIDLGPLRPGLRVFHKDGRVDLAPQAIAEDLDRLARDLEARPAAEQLLLIGRRELRTCNSWMHNVPALVAGRERCVLYVHPDDAASAGVRDGDTAVLESRVHAGDVPIHVTDDIRPGVVSLPHGWGHAPAAPFQRVAGAHPGASANDWTDDQQVEAVVGQAVLNGVPVRLRAKPAASAAA